MNLQKLQEMNAKIGKVSKSEIENYLNGLGINPDRMEKGTKFTIPSIELVKGVVNGIPFYSIPVVESTGEARNLSLSAFTRTFRNYETGQKTTPSDILDKTDQANAVYEQFRDCSRGEALEKLVGKTIELKEIESFEGVSRNGDAYTTTLFGFVLVDAKK